MAAPASALDAKNNILFAACRDNKNMVILSATDGHIITDLPIGNGCDGATFNPATMETFSSQGDGTLTVIKEDSPTSFSVEQTVPTPARAKTLTLDTKTGQILSDHSRIRPHAGSTCTATGRGTSSEFDESCTRFSAAHSRPHSGTGSCAIGSSSIRARTAAPDDPAFLPDCCGRQGVIDAVIVTRGPSPARTVAFDCIPIAQSDVRLARM